MKQLAKLYKRDRKKKLLTWYVTFEEDGTLATFSGEDGGKMKTTVTTSKPKNVGRSNETTHYTQAAADAQSKWNKQIDKGYCEDPDNIVEGTLPPLATNYKGNESKAEWPCYGLFKLDGVRSTAFYRNGRVELQTRGGKEYPGLKHTKAELYDTFFEGSPDLVVDGELYCHGMHLEDIVSAAKKPNDNSPLLGFRVFDVYDPDEPDQLYRNRYLRYISEYYHGCVEPIEARLLKNEAEMLAMHQEAVDAGYEGLIIRNLDRTFKFNLRTTDILKYKVPLSSEFLVVGMEESKTGFGIPVCQLTSNEGTVETFKAPFKASVEFKKAMLANKGEYIGQWLTVDFESYSKYGIPTKPIGKAYRGMINGEVQE